MRNSLLSLTIAFISLACSNAAFADVRVKSRQTISGQSYESTTYIKGKRQRSESFGGMVSITQCDLRRGVQLNTNTNTYMVNPFAPVAQTSSKTVIAATDKNVVDQRGGRVTTTVTIKDTGERKQMFGYTARHLIITMETVSSPNSCNKTNTKMQTDGWYIDAAFALDCDYGGAYQSFAGSRAAGCQDKYEVKTIGTAKRGYPVYERMTMFDESGEELYSMISEVVEFSQATLEAGLFDIPAGFREVSDASQMYAAPTSYGESGSASSSSVQQADSGVASSIKNAAKSPEKSAAPLGPKQAGILRIGIAPIKTGATGEGVTAADLAAAVQNTFIQKLNDPRVEVVALESKIESAIDSEAISKECDYVIHATASHKKGGGGFGMFKSLAPMLSSIAPLAGTGSTAGHAAGSVASQAILTTAAFSGQVKNKDEVSLDMKLNKAGGASAFAKLYKAKAKSDGDDVISLIVGQAAQAIVSVIRQT